LLHGVLSTHECHFPVPTIVLRPRCFYVCQVLERANVQVGDWVLLTMASPAKNDFTNINMGLDHGCNDGMCDGPEAFQ
jgi:hypothetical protein